MTVLFTDIVTSTETAAKLGDRRWRELLGSHHAAVRRALRAHGGHEMDTAGDGFFAVFQHPGEAIHCAVAAREAVAALGLRIRAGIHTGEVEATGEKVSGLAVVIAARVLASCEPGQIRVTSTVRDLVTGSGHEFTDVGDHQLKGVPGQWHLYGFALEGPVPGEITVAPPRTASARHSIPRALVILGGAGVIAAAAVAAALLLRQTPGTTVAAAADTVGRVDPQQSDLVDVVKVASGTSLLATDGSDLWIVSETALTLTHLDIASGESTTRGLDGVPTALAVSDGIVYVAQAFEHSIQRFAADTDSAEAPIEGMAVGRLIYDGDQGWGIDPVAGGAVRLAPGQEPKRIPLTDGSRPTDVSIGFGSVWIANAIGPSLTRIEPSTGVIEPISLADPPTSIASPTGDGGVMWVLSETRDSLTRINPETNRVIATVDVCDAPVDVALG